MSRVLVIEDNPLVRSVIQHELESAGYAVRSVPDGPAALAAVQGEAPDAVVLDLKMPGMDGREVLRRLKRHNRRLPVFVFSVHGDFPDRLVHLADADGVFAKSADLGPLIRAIGQSLR